MVLAHSTHTWLPLTEQWIYQQVKHIHGIEQVVFCDKKADAFGALVNTYYNPNSPFSLVSRVREKLGLPDAFRKKMLDERDDTILFSHYGVQGFHDMNLKKKKHITRFYGYDLTRTIGADKRWKKRYDRLFDLCDLFIVEGPSMKNILCDIGCPEKKIGVSYLGTEAGEINFVQRTENKVLNVLIACATAERKGILYSLQALEKAIHQYKIPIHIHWVGGRNSDYTEYINYEKRLNDFVTSTGLNEYITRYGFVSPDTLRTIAYQCQIALHPSVWAADGDCEGGYPVVLTELMATGLPVITTTHCDIPELVTPSNGYLCPEKDVEALVAALIESHALKTYCNKSVLARQTIEDKFDWNRLGEALTKIILS